MAKRCSRVLDEPIVSFEFSPTQNIDRRRKSRMRFMRIEMDVGLRVSVGMTRIFTIFCVGPLVSV